MKKIIIPNHILSQYRRLVRYCNMAPQPIETQLVRKIYSFIDDACSNCAHCRNEALILHSLQVAQVTVNELGLNEDSLAASMLYKFVQIGTIPIENIELHFNKKIFLLVQELLKIPDFDTAHSGSNAENFRKLLLTLVSDVRVILIKLADRLFVMRNLDHETKESQLKIARETFDLYGPIGHRLGLYNLKSELEDLSMKYLNPEKYFLIETKLKETASARNKFIKDFTQPIIEGLIKQKLKFEVKSRTKSIYSIWNKMNKQGIDFEEIYDVFAIRIILESKPSKEKSDCWRSFSIVTDLYQSNPQRMRDWISVPKSTGYESLHATVVTTSGKWVEVQIRTARMNEIAEKGLAAHWKYKGQQADVDLDKLLDKIREILEAPEKESIDFIDNLRLDLYSNEIFVFTPKGELKKLPKGATVLDFAFEIHSDVGSKCIGAKINGKNVPIRQTLNTGDKIEIITSKNQKPKNDWLDFVITSKAINKIKLAIKEELLAAAEDGKEIFKRRLRNWKIPYNDILVNNLIHHLKLKTSVDFYYLISSEKISLTDIKETIFNINSEQLGSGAEKIGEVPIEKVIPSLQNKVEDTLLIDEKAATMVYKLAKCCNPSFGDDIFGFVTINDGIKVHQINCPNAKQMLSLYGYRMVKARWAGSDGKSFFRTAIKVKGSDEIGILSKITDVISKDLKVNVISVNLNSSNGYFEGYIKLIVKDNAHLDAVINKLLRVKKVISAVRIDNLD